MAIRPDSHRSPIYGDNVVATSQPLAAQVGLTILNRGGNAVDAAISTAITLTVVEPTMNGIGSDAFCIVWDGTKLHGLNASGRYPKGWSLNDFKQDQPMPSAGWRSVTVPGAVSAWVELSRRFGRMKFEELFEPAIRYATEGFLVSGIIADQWHKQLNRFNRFSEFNRIFTNQGKAPHAGDRFYLPDHADSLGRIAATHGEDFYGGELAHRMVEDSKKNHGKLSLTDLHEHRPQWVAPISMNHLGLELHEIPPSGQGIATLIALGILNQLDSGLIKKSNLITLHIEIEAMKIALHKVYSQVSDPLHMHVTVDDLLSEDLHRALASTISTKKTLKLETRQPITSDTVYLTTADSNGMMVSFIQSNYMGFGSGVVVPNTGISLQNRAAGFTTQRYHPNCVDGNKFPFHTIIPGFIKKNEQPLSSFGVMGGDMQAQGHLQLFRSLAKHSLNPQAIVNAPRWKLNKDGALLVEETFGADILNGLKSLGHEILQMPYGTYDFGAAQMIIKGTHGYAAGSEPRRDGQAVTF
ncbi:MAG: gamma-glutamyltransferase family protein [Proteobacteria bacterium]|nr:gamma-glutamyltransferase family protein [Pseudomonadota bacterium]